MRIIYLFALLLFAPALFAQNQHYIPFKKAELWGYADTTGNIKIEPEYEKVSLHNRYNRYKVGKDSKYGIVDQTGKIIVPVKYKSVDRDRPDGYIVGDPGAYYFYDFNGKLIIDKPYKRIYYDRGKDLLKLMTDTSLIKYNYKENKIISSKKFKSEEIFMDFEEDDSDHKINRVHIEYRKIIAGKKQGISKYTKTETGTYRNKKVTETTDTLDFAFHEMHVYNYHKLKFALFRKGKKWGVIYDDSVQIKAEFDQISPKLINNKCEDLYFIARKKDAFGIIDLRGNTLVDFKYDDIPMHETVKERSMSCFQIKSGIAVKNNDRYGLITINDKVILACSFDDIKFVNMRGYYIYVSGKKKGLYNHRFKTGLDIKLTDNFGSISKVDNHLIVQIKDSNGTLKGYLNQYGVKFYEE